MKTCKQCDNTYSSDLFKNRMKLCKYCREQTKIKNDENKKQWKLNNPEKVKEYRQKYEEENIDEIMERKKKWRESEKGKAKIQDYRQKVHYCELCDYEVKKEKKSQHEKSLNHQYFLQKSLNGEKLERPDEKELKNGVLWFRCLKCKKKEIYCKRFALPASAQPSLREGSGTPKSSVANT